MKRDREGGGAIFGQMGLLWSGTPHKPTHTHTHEHTVLLTDTSLQTAPVVLPALCPAGVGGLCWSSPVRELSNNWHPRETNEPRRALVDAFESSGFQNALSELIATRSLPELYFQRAGRRPRSLQGAGGGVFDNGTFKITFQSVLVVNTTENI